MATALTEDTTSKMLIAQVHVGTENVDSQMQKYVWNRRADGQHILNLQYTWDKIVLAARIIAAIENPKDVAVISARDWGQRAVLKFASHTGATPIAGRFTPGTFTNQQQQKDFKEPRLIIVTDTRVDGQPLIEASYVNIPTIAFCNSDSPVQYVDVAIPCNNAAPQSIGLIYWLLCREVLRIKGKISRSEEWNVMPDLFFWRDPTKEEDKSNEEEQAAELSRNNRNNADSGDYKSGGGFDVLANQPDTATSAVSAGASASSIPAEAWAGADAGGSSSGSSAQSAWTQLN